MTIAAATDVLMAPTIASTSTDESARKRRRVSDDVLIPDEITSESTQDSPVVPAAAPIVTVRRTKGAKQPQRKANNRQRNTMTIAAATDVLMAPTIASTSTDESARKRRRVSDDVLIPDEIISESTQDSPVVPAAAPIVTVRRTKGAKRPQMKYDPSVPMTKEETSVWRREQRRKRNRESAAACRRRQRDRISELEVEVSDWRAKFDEALNKLKDLEGEEAVAHFEALRNLAPPTRCSTPENELAAPEDTTSMSIPDMDCSHIITPNCPKFVPLINTSEEDDIRFPVLEVSADVTADKVNTSLDSLDSRVEKQQYLKEMITRPAVKITGTVSATPLDNIESVCDDLLQVVPESCLSLTELKTMPFPETCPSLVTASTSKNSTPVTTDGESDEDSDLGEFLADAVQWL
eukprot:CAMPEP_0113436662 /NCGR_PEP_ID=MMETSP0013_2-20120614/36970_1 /TAXON_ID=2843 ORGANISM="Skeletonema costatum, Strain 1716" /NCGR_SAMPLE_ID=MMETSP0013_2 /ASSEMBLY_ACC=CAM_ASM_000158 /LENGTH=406 /DNA_ID=CAMNT_0000327201 /DNA_START=65 /DNA_END=1285 /DNA_ORIENTATION=- /assembly_acc=CAM_ASM_000158